MTTRADLTKLIGRVSKSDVEQLEQLWDSLHAPKDLTRLRLVLLNLKKIITISSGKEFFFKGADFQNLFDSILIDQVLNALESTQYFSDHPQLISMSDKARGIINEHPEWAMLIIPVTSSVFNNKVFRQHQSVVLRCSAVQRRRLAQREFSSIGTEIELSCRNLRYIATGKFNIDQLPNLSSENSLEDYWKLLLDEENKPIKPLAGLEQLVRKVLIHKGKSRQQGSNSSIRALKSAKVQLNRDDPEHIGPKLEIHAFQAHRPIEDLDKARMHGMHPDEFQTQAAVAIQYSKDNPTAGFALKDHYRRQTNQIKQIAKSNQRLPFRYGQLTSTELALAAQETYLLYKGKSLFDKGVKYPKHAAVLLMLTLWLGRPIDEVLNIRLYINQTHLPKSRKGLLAFLIEEKAFVIPIPTPEWKNNLPELSQKLLYTQFGGHPVHFHDALIITSPVNIGRRLEELYTSNTDSSRAKHVSAFPEELKYQSNKDAKKFLSNINQKGQYRLTLERLSQALFDSIVDHSSDWADAYILTGHRFTTTEVTSHYYSVKGEHLLEVFQASTVKLQNRLFHHLSIDEKRFYGLEQQVENSKEFGSRLNLKPLLLKEVVRHLKLQLKASIRANPSDDRLISIHNSLTLYLCFWLLFETGYRAVNDLLFSLSEIDLETGFIVISDKDNNDNSNARIIWLTTPLRKQLKLYLLHLEKLKQSVSRHPTITSKLEDVLSNQQPKNPLFFFLSKTFQWTSITPAQLRSRTPEFPLPANINRHYLRSMLRDKGCPAEYVDAFMGHWQKGQEPFGKFSTLSPVELFGVIAPIIESLRKEVGWTVQVGLADG
ncbi:MAG: site-specific integrase [Neptuniibacter sp.]